MSGDVAQTNGMSHTAVLDPRSADEAERRPMVDAVNIPLAELSTRVHELPPKNETVLVGGPAALAAETIAWLEGNGRRAEAAENIQYLDSSDKRDIGAAEQRSVRRLWRPNALLEEVLPKLPPGHALDIACGVGRDAVHMASLGWQVTAIDHLPDALERGRDLERRYLRDAPPISWIQRDAEADDFEPGARFDLITIFRFLHRPLFEKLSAWLNPAGNVICETFTTRHRELHGKPSRDAYLLTPGELPRLLAGYDIKHHSEAERGGAHTARVWAAFDGIAYSAAGA